MNRCRALLVVALCSAPALAHAAALYPPPTTLTMAASPRPPAVSVTVSPVHLALPVFELAAELRVAPMFGLALIGGAGSVQYLGDRFTVYEGGAQAAWYMTGDFGGGWKLGLEALYVVIDGSASGVRAVGEGLSFGPFLGWKRVWDSGFTLDLQGGVAVYTARAEASSSDTTSGRTAVGDAELGPLLNINLGWSF